MPNWRVVPGTENRVAVSDEGDILVDGSVPKFYENRGYQQFSIKLDGKWRTKYVHTMVLEAFVGPRPTIKHQARHLNDVKGDDRLVNLAWGTRGDNNRDRVINGIHHYAMRDQCTRGHLLEGVNLQLRVIEGEVKQRVCVACRNARTQKSRGAEATLQELADAQYARLVGDNGS